MIIVRKFLTFFHLLKKNGLKGVFSVILQKIHFLIQPISYIPLRKYWKMRCDYEISPLAFGISPESIGFQNNFSFPIDIKFSILVPLYNTPASFLKELIASVLNQTYTNWELCFADGSNSDYVEAEKICKEISLKDSRIKYKRLERNLGISQNTNSCIEMATGEYISLLDHDDLLHPSALFETMKMIVEQRADVVYTDEAVFESPNLHKIKSIHFKPDFSQRILETNNYVCHFLSFKKSILERTGLFDSICDGSQDYDMILKLSEVTSKISHIPICLYYWRASPASTAGTSDAKKYTVDAGQIALQNHFKRLGKNVSVTKNSNPNTYDIYYEDEDSWDKFCFEDSFVFREQSVFPKIGKL